MAQHFSCSIPLPAGFRVDDVLAFHRRDPQGISEAVDASALRKGLRWQGLPACLSLRFSAGGGEGAQVATAELAVDGAAAADSGAALALLLRRMLGLTQDVDAFARRHQQHPQLGPLLARQAGLRVPLTATPFEAISWAVASQQISVAAAVSLRRKLILAVGCRHSAGLYCYPEAAQVAALSEEQLRQAGFSLSKARTLRLLAAQVAAGHLPLAEWAERADDLPVAEVRERLLALPGIGPWTVNYALLRGFGWLDGSLHGDAAVRRNLQTLLGRAAPLSEKEAEAWLAPFSPWRALVAAHLWAASGTAAA